MQRYTVCLVLMLAATLSVNLLGAPALTTEEFQRLRAEPRPILGVSLKLVSYNLLLQ